MTGFWLVSYIALWITVLVLAWFTLSLLRLVGQLHQRIGPAGAAVVSGGLEIGERLPDILETQRIVDNAQLSFPKKKESLLVFIAPNCPACEDLIPSLIPFANRERDHLDTIAISSGDRADGNNYLASMFARTGISFLASSELTKATRVGGTPFAIWLDREGKVNAKGIVNHTEHLESLKNASESGFATLQQHRQETHHEHHQLQHQGKVD
jgi:methylamine dehydrogenase accessory protein MauD